ncbi:glutamate--cysteine ligase [Bdellovibrionota bacterium FG-1]
MIPPSLSRTKKQLAEGIRKNRRKIWEWHMEQIRHAPPPIYCSIDLRDSGHKIVPVDSNLYPAGFNNICPEDQRTAPPIFKAQVEAIFGRMNRAIPQRILILPESHTSNLFYLENLHSLSELVKNAGFDVRLGWYGPLPSSHSLSPLGSIQLVSETQKHLEAWPISIHDGILSAGDFTPEMILLNNDFSSGYPKDLDAVTQPILPSHTLGWHSRKKTDHFRHYNELVGEFAAIVGIDPWLIQVDTEEVSPVRFNDDDGVEQVAQAVDRILLRTQKSYDVHSITQKPFVFVKNNSGTYGMGIMVVHSGDEIRHMNRRTKNKMSVGKNRSEIVSVAIQEGIPTATLVDRLAAEPVIYLSGGELIGGFLRTNTDRGIEDNLNSQGMVFRKLCMSDLREFEEDDPASGPEHPSQEEPLLELIYGAIARISALAAGRELKETTWRRMK